MARPPIETAVARLPVWMNAKTTVSREAMKRHVELGQGDRSHPKQRRSRYEDAIPVNSA